MIEWAFNNPLSAGLLIGLIPLLLSDYVANRNRRAKESKQ